ncbi:uncharacterized protein LOC143194852 [Rhynchophorus ferrugineus]|uniref:uncharacterized protein LOC143194852 n=1 Tax=Rhynchophorus ferrugineus TaxID=354439 RepID=UPI003FCDA9B5
MQFKLLVTFFALLVTANAGLYSSRLNGGMSSMVAEIFEQIFKEIDEIFAKANEAMAKIENHEPEIEKKIVDAVIAEGKNLNTLFINMIRDFEGNVTADGKIVLDCIINQKDKFEAAFTESSTDIGKCIATQAPKITNEMKTMLKEFTGFKDDFEADIQTLKKCSSDDMVCFLTFGTSIIDTVKKISPALHKDFENILEFITTISTDSRQCMETAFMGIRNHALDIFNTAVTCFRK